MKSRVILMVVLVVAVLMAMSVASAFAADPSGGWGQGGAPTGHGLSGSAWGAAVSSVAQTGGLGCHASGSNPNACK